MDKGVRVKNPLRCYVHKANKMQEKAITRGLRSFMPTQVAALYDMSSRTGFNGAGQSVAIIELGGGYTAEDMNTYFRTKLGFAKVPTIRSVFIGGAKNNPSDRQSSLEVVLDIQIAAAVAPGATIVVYFAKNSFSGFYQAIRAAVNSTVYNHAAISISWGAPETLWSLSTQNTYNTLFQQAAQKGIAVFAASGDRGSRNGMSVPTTDYPASSPWVVGCGGTTLVSDGMTIDAETVWGSAGGGFSARFPRPAFQTGFHTNPRRGVPDVCACADPATGYRIYMGRRDVVVGGTSAVSPLMAGFTALLRQSKGPSITSSLLSRLYAQRSALFTDIVAGDIGDGYVATASWDPASGLGRLNGAAAVATSW